MLYVLTQFLSNRSMSWWMIVGANWLTWSQMPQGSVLYTSCTPRSFAPLVETKLYGNADESTSVAVVPFQGERIAVTESMNRDPNRICAWCDLWGMQLNASNLRV